MSETNTQTEHKLPMHAHLAELRNRVLCAFVFLFIAFAGCYYFAENIYNFLVAPLAEILEGQDRRLIYTGLAEAFFTYMKVAFYTALFISFPIFAWQFYRFLAPGLYKNEKLVLLPFLIATPLLFVAGGALVYYQIFPLAWKFFLSFESLGAAEAGNSMAIQLEARVSEYLSLVIQLIFAFGLAFQLPVLLLLLVKVGVISSKWLATKRRYAIVIIFIFAAAFTPPDIISQIGLALPMLLLYECSVLFAKVLEKKKDSNEDKEEEHA